MVDAFSRQLRELFLIDNTRFIGEPKDEVYAAPEFATYAEKQKNNFVYVYYPWLNQTVKTVPADDYFRLKTNRNQDLIAAAEQRQLYDYRVAVLGMSVGSNIAFVLTQAGISRHIVIADFDELDTTNLNRILAGVHQVGLNKTIVAARRIYEDNPFAEVTIWPEGVTSELLEDGLKSGRIHCLVEEIDDIPLKIMVRELAMKYRVPVLMITDNGDGVVLHVERYDLGYDKIFDQDLSYWRAMETEFKKGVPKELAGKIIINNIVGGPDKVDPKMLASVKRVLAKELVSWSQLGSAALLGGVMVTVAIKRIVLGEDKRLSLRAHIYPTF